MPDFILTETHSQGSESWTNATPGSVFFAYNPIFRIAVITRTEHSGGLQIAPSSDFELPFVPQGRVNATAVEGHFPGLGWEF